MGSLMKKQIQVAVLFFFAICLFPAIGFAEPIPDTGQEKCYNDSEEIPCPQPGESFYGQDAQCDGPQPSYTKLGQNGVELPDTATFEDGWIMTQDNVTGLIWEVKQNKDEASDFTNPHDTDNTYTW